ATCARGRSPVLEPATAQPRADSVPSDCATSRPLPSTSLGFVPSSADARAWWPTRSTNVACVANGSWINSVVHRTTSSVRPSGSVAPAQTATKPILLADLLELEVLP